MHLPMKSSALLGLACLALTSCSWLGLKKKSPIPQAPSAPTLVGRIASIPADHRFVLIQSYGKWNVTTGDILISRGPDARTANLLATGEVLGQFAAADVQSGTFEVGDAVLLPPPVSKKSPTHTPKISKNSSPAQTIQKP